MVGMSSTRVTLSAVILRPKNFSDCYHLGAKCIQELIVSTFSTVNTYSLVLIEYFSEKECILLLSVIKYNL